MAKWSGVINNPSRCEGNVLPSGSRMSWREQVRSRLNRPNLWFLGQIGHAQIPRPNLSSPELAAEFVRSRIRCRICDVQIHWPNLLCPDSSAESVMSRFLDRLESIPSQPFREGKIKKWFMTKDHTMNNWGNSNYIAVLQDADMHVI